jgi:hypothetical protein
MTGPLEPVDASQLEVAIEHLLHAKADRAANGANPFELSPRPYAPPLSRMGCARTGYFQSVTLHTVSGLSSAETRAS